MDKRRIKKLIKKYFDELCSTNNFIAISDTLFLRIKGNVLHIINFDLGSTGLTCLVAMMPLYTLEHTLCVTLNMGSRLSRFKTIQNEWWPYENIEQSLCDIMELLIKNGLPWFEQYGTPEGIINFIKINKKEEYGLVSFDLFHQKKYLGFSLLYLGGVEEGIRCLEDMISEIKDNAAEFMLIYKKQLRDLVNTIKSHPNKISETLDAYIYDNALTLRLPMELFANNT
ncbi:MAG: hypothetical protein PHF63_09165 [Herbinix sp.]|nr:hypothetical protein [Herbinix sp.]